FSTLVLACCSILYELLLAQTLSTTMGNTILRYNITVGLYMASMGVGAIIYSRWKKDELYLKLLNVEILLSVMGALGPILVLFFEMCMQKLSSSEMSYHGFIIQSLLFCFNHSLIIVIGLLSGFELPLLMDIGAKIVEKFDIKVLIVDYVGTLIGVVLFPIWLLPEYGIFTVAFFIAFLNSLVALTIAVKSVKKKSKIIQSGAVFIALLLMLIFQQPINEFVVTKFYFMQ
ncbi:MAG: spermidine synthase, partial [Thermoproteota archaeon]